MKPSARIAEASSSSGIVLVEAHFTRDSLVKSVSLVNRVPVIHRSSFNLRFFLHENVFILLCMEGHNDVLHFDIALVKARFTQEPLVKNVSLVNLTAKCVHQKHRNAFNLRSFLQGNVFILLIIEGEKGFMLAVEPDGGEALSGYKCVNSDRGSDCVGCEGDGEVGK